jgi:aryl-alcohol dehydrogenase-like predicted oxidoreductase
MNHRPLGQTGRSVSAIGLGCMGMSEFYGTRDDAQSLQTLDAALDHGIDFFDTADMYGIGHNETLLGPFVARHRDRVTLATKFAIVRNPDGSGRIDNSPDYVRQACDASLKRLGIDAIDLYYCHRRDPAVPIEDMVGAMAGLVAAGKVRAIGLSEVAPETLRRAHAVHPVAAVQTEYSLWSRDPESEMLGLCRDLGVTFVAYSPLGRAFLTGSVTAADDLAEDDFRRRNPRFQDDALARNRVLTDRLAGFAAGRGATSAQIALAWMLARYPHVVPIPGTTKPHRVAENAGAAAIALSAAEVAALDAMFPPEAVTGDRYAPEGMRTLGL